MDKQLICIDILLATRVQGSLCVVVVVVVVVIQAQCLTLDHISLLEVYECKRFHDFTAGRRVKFGFPKIEL